MTSLMVQGHRIGSGALSARSAIARDWPATTLYWGADLIDLVAVARRLDGERLPLDRAETRFAVVYGTRRLGLSAADLADRLGLHQRVVTRIRSQEADRAY